jgi:ubiquinone/menaquinone biosynthesis C-methylase UbiE
MNISGNEQKYKTQKALSRSLIGNLLTKIVVLVEKKQPKNILDVGCGKGLVVSFLKRHLEKSSVEQMDFWGFDISSENIQVAKKVFGNEKAFIADVYGIDLPERSFDLVLALEILEHLEKPQKALKQLQKITKRNILLSVPLEPYFGLSNLFFRRNMEEIKKEESRINKWTKGKFVKLVNKYFEVEEVTISFPWVLVLARKK